MNWLKESNRIKHLICAIPIGLIFTILAVLGCAFGMEFKDWQYKGKFDWLDIAATMIGGAIGQILQIILILLLQYMTKKRTRYLLYPAKDQSNKEVLEFPSEEARSNYARNMNRSLVIPSDFPENDSSNSIHFLRVFCLKFLLLLKLRIVHLRVIQFQLSS